MHAKLYLLFLLFFINLSTFSKVIIKHLPPEGNVIDISNIMAVRKDLQKLFTNKKDHIDYLTSSEAHNYLSDYVHQIYGAQANELINHYFNDRYFGQEKETPKTTAEIAKNDPFLFGHITNMIMLGIPGHEGTMEEARKRWAPQTLMLTPKEVFDAYANDPWHSKRIHYYKDFEKYKEHFPKESATIFSEKYFIPAEESKRKDYFLHNPLGFFTQDLVKNIYKTAKKIMAVTEQGDYIVIFGNTPYFVGRALQKLVSQDSNSPNYRKIIEFPFSGGPNRIRELNLPNLKDLVTKERLDHLRQRLMHVELTPQNKDLETHAVYFVDVIATGSGLAYVIEELLRMFEKAGVQIPDFNIISLNKIDVFNEEDERNATIARKNADDGQTVKFHFPSNSNEHFIINAQVIYLTGHGLLDKLLSKDWRVFPEYNAAYWQHEYDYLLTKPPSKFTTILFDFFDTNLANIMSSEQK